MTDDKETFELSRRKALASLGTVGAASAGAGLGTSAYFNDEELFENNQLTAGELDLIVNYATSVDQGDASPSGTTVTSGTINGDRLAGYTYNIADVKPGDSGELEFCIKAVDNPAFVWLCGELTSNAEESVNEPESIASAESNNTVSSNVSGADNGELAQSIQATLSYDTDTSTDGADLGANNQVEILSGTLNNVLADLSQGIPLDGGSEPEADTLVAGAQDPFAGSSENGDFASPCVRLTWEIPTSVGNAIQSDSVSFDLTFSAQQSRHNDGTQNLCGGEDGGSGEDGGTGGGSQLPGISFVAFCASSIDETNITDITVTERNVDDEPIEIDWESDVTVNNVVVKTGGGALAIENFDGGTSGTAKVSEGDDRKENQTPSTPCPDHDDYVKFEYDENDNTFEVAD